MNAAASHHVGAAPLPIPPGVVVRAVYGGPAACYRYRLQWSLPLMKPSRGIMWLLMNPSVAGHDCADRTVLKCWRLSLRWGFDRMLVGNSAAYRATDQRRLAEVPDPVGPENIGHLRRMACEAEMIVVAHGSPTVAAARRFGPEAVKALRSAGHVLHVMRLGPSGTPVHPLYQSEQLNPAPWEGLTQ